MSCGCSWQQFGLILRIPFNWMYFLFMCVHISFRIKCSSTEWTIVQWFSRMTASHMFLQHVKTFLECVLYICPDSACLFLHKRPHSGHSYCLESWYLLKCNFKLYSSLSQLLQSSCGHFTLVHRSRSVAVRAFQKNCYRISPWHTHDIYLLIYCADFSHEFVVYSHCRN